ncbi:MAG: hypothetical protein V7704_22375 [Aurantimonas endophytica]|uniref:hypothetical protein n=1 Tax=Aurantimonas endophytica TaxID=1522175 RepID=UPI003001047F
MTKQLQIADLKDSLRRASEEFSAFVAGPYVKPDEPTHAANSASPGATIRLRVIKELTSKDFSVYLGEDNRLRDGGEKNYGQANNAVVFERHYIINHVDAVILFPCSVGSFCEFGDWAPDEEICKKTLIFIEEKYKEKQNYFCEGPTKFADSNGAKIYYINYDDLENIVGKSIDFLNLLQSKKRIRVLYGRDR